MHILSLNSVQNMSQAPSFAGKKKPHKKIAYTEEQVKNFTEEAKKREEREENCYKACVAADIWDERMYIPKPRNEKEKNIIREILTHRANLERYVRLSNDEFRLRDKIAELEELKATNPTSPRIAVLEKELKAKGNLTSVLNTINKQKEEEIKRNKESYKYLTDLDKLTLQLMDENSLKVNQLNKFCHEARKYGLNPNREYNAKDLLLILSGGTPVKQTNKVQEVKEKELTKEETDFLEKVSIEYENALKKLVNIFSENKNHSIDVSTARQQIKMSNFAFLDKHKNIYGILEKTYENIENKYQEVVAKITPITLWSPDEIWQNMEDLERAIGIQMVDVAAIRKQLKETPNNLTYQKILEGKEVSLESFKANWGLFLEKSIEIEERNIESAKNSGVLDEYKYLTEENSIINRHKALYEIYKENGDRMPDEHWFGVFTKEICTNTVKM